MRPISSLRDTENYPELDETARLRAMSILESVRQFLELRAAFESQLEQTETLFEDDHQQALIELQARLRRQVDHFSISHSQALSNRQRTYPE